jgi:hypothetical protein
LGENVLCRILVHVQPFAAGIGLLLAIDVVEPVHDVIGGGDVGGEGRGDVHLTTRRGRLFDISGYCASHLTCKFVESVDVHRLGLGSGHVPGISLGLYHLRRDHAETATSRP